METICIKCTMDPTSHSFKKISEKDGVCTYYTKPINSKLYTDTDGILSHYDNALKQIGDKKWIWIFDSINFSMKHAMEIKIATSLAKLINDNYSKNLKKLVILNPTWHIRTILTIVSPFLSDDVKKLIKIDEKNSGN